MMAIEDIYYKEKDTRTTRRLTTNIELNWFSIMPYASFYNVFRENSRIYMDFLSEIINEKYFFLYYNV